MAKIEHKKSSKNVLRERERKKKEHWSRAYVEVKIKYK
jgi:hypothetical protein